MLPVTSSSYFIYIYHCSASASFRLLGRSVSIATPFIPCNECFSFRERIPPCFQYSRAHTMELVNPIVYLIGENISLTHRTVYTFDCSVTKDHFYVVYLRN